MRREPHTRKMLTVLPVFASKPHNSVSPHMSLMPSSHHPFTTAQSEGQYRPFRRTSGFPATFCPTWVVQIPTVFHSHLLWGLLFLARVLRAGDPDEGLGIHALLGLRYPFQFSIATRGFETSQFQVPAPPTSLDMAASLHT